MSGEYPQDSARIEVPEPGMMFGEAGRGEQAPSGEKASARVGPGPWPAISVESRSGGPTGRSTDRPKLPPVASHRPSGEKAMLATGEG